MKKYLVFVLLLTSVCLFAQQKNAAKILDAVKQKFNKVEDYQADVTGKIDISFAKVPETKATVYFKQPDKVKIDSKGFAMLPKQSVNFSPVEMLNGNYNAFFVKLDTVDNQKLDVIKIIPNNDSSEIILSTLWIDTDNSLVHRVELVGKKTGTTTITLDYDNTEYSLPSKVTFSFNLGDVDMPQQMSGQQQDSNNNQGRHGRRFQSISGKVTLTYSNYKINKGIPDSFFEKGEKK